jgi:hypothetical protein
MAANKWGLGGLLAVLLVLYNGAQPSLSTMRSMNVSPEVNPKENPKLRKEQYGPSLEWLTRLMNASASSNDPKDENEYTAKLDFRVMSSLMVAGLASGFKSQVANLLWMKSDEYWHKGMLTRQNPLMELVVTLDPQFIEAWSTAGWHWAYNIYADVEINPKYKDNPKQMREQQERAIQTGLSYLHRGSEMNPDKYRLWFEHGWTRAEKAGIYDEETVRLYRMARAQPDARTVYRDVPDKDGKMRQKEEEGLDILGRTIAHLYERVPDIDKALDMYGRDLLKATPQEIAGLKEVGKYLALYGWDYATIVQMYEGGDATMKAQIKRIVPDVEKMAAAHQVRLKMQARNDQPTGAYISIAARYLPAWNMMKAGNIQGAINQMVGVMQADPKYHLQGLPRLAKVLELRGDAPAAIQKHFEEVRNSERTSSQDIGLHFLAKLYERAAAAQKDEAKKKPLLKLAYETWYRSRARDSLDFYAKRNTLLYEDKYGFTTPKEIVEQVKASRKGGAPNAAPAAPPNVEQYYQAPHEHSEGDGHEHTEGDGHNH